MIPPFLLGPLAGAAGMAVAGLAFWGWLAFIHDPNVRAAQVAEIAAAVAEEQGRAHEAATAALEAQAATYAAQQAALTQTRRRIANAARPPALLSDAIRAAVLREPRPAGHGPP